MSHNFIDWGVTYLLLYLYLFVTISESQITATLSFSAKASIGVVTGIQFWLVLLLYTVTTI